VRKIGLERLLGLGENWDERGCGGYLLKRGERNKNLTSN